MYTVLLAEDEPLVRMGIKSMVDWEKLGMRVCAECSDGAEALQTCRRLKPDLIITDLKMPVMDGMSLIRAVRAEDARTRILVLTCLEDFDAARQAIEFDVSGYVMKLSCTVEKLTDILRRVRGELDSLSARERRPEEVDLQPIRESMFFDYVRYRSLDCAHFLKGMQSMGMAVRQGRLSLTVMRLMEYERFLEKDPGGRTLRTMVLGLVRLALRDSDRWECYCDYPGEYVLLFACGDAAAVPDLTMPGQITGMTAQHAVRHGATAARNIAALRGTELVERLPVRGFTLPVSRQLAICGSIMVKIGSNRETSSTCPPPPFSAWRSAIIAAAAP